MTTRCAIAFAVVGLLAVLMTAQASANGSGPSPVPLTGETLITSEAGDPGTSTVTGTCNPLGTSTFTFTVTGVAVGPYQGTFVEEGTFTLGPVGFPLEAFDATFTIASAEGTVTGTKTLTGVTPTHGGVCGEFAFGGTEEDAVSLQTAVAYTAQITTSGGTATDQGDSFVTYGDTQLRGEPAGGSGFSFVETFASTSFSVDEDEDDDDQGEDEDEDDDQGGGDDQGEDEG